MAAEGIIEILIETLGAGLETMAVGDSKSKKIGCFITFIIIVLILVGLFWYLNSGDDTVIQAVPEIIEE
jgi:hypothetical protein